MTELYNFPNASLKYWNGCQRNWDYSKPVNKDHIKLFIDIALSAPSSNNLNLLHIQIFENSLLTQKNITHYARGHLSHAIKTSTEAPFTIFFAKRDNIEEIIATDHRHDYLEMLQRHKKNLDKFNAECTKHAHMHASLIAGACSYKAIELGYKTAMNCCFLPNTSLYKSSEKVFFSLGIGYPLLENHEDRGKDNNRNKNQGPYRPKYKTKFSYIQDDKILDIGDLN